jgi:hypothetical protein
MDCFDRNKFNINQVPESTQATKIFRISSSHTKKKNLLNYRRNSSVIVIWRKENETIVHQKTFEFPNKMHIPCNITDHTSTSLSFPELLVRLPKRMRFEHPIQGTSIRTPIKTV